jgi:uncharacterized Zn finger protein
MIDAKVKRIHFKCSNCENKGEAIEVIYKYINDTGGFILQCNQCNSDFFLGIKNPDENFESRIVTNNF